MSTEVGVDGYRPNERMNQYEELSCELFLVVVLRSQSSCLNLHDPSTHANMGRVQPIYQASERGMRWATLPGALSTIACPFQDQKRARDAVGIPFQVLFLL